MDNIKVSKVVQALEQAHTILNEYYYKNELKSVKILINENNGKSKNTLGHFNPRSEWNKENSIVIYGLAFGKGVEQIMSTLLHEMAHQANHEKGIIDDSKGRHKREFRDMANAHGLEVQPITQKNLGFSHTKISEETKRWLPTSGIDLETIAELINDRKQVEEDGTKAKAKTPYCKYSCEECGITFALKKEVKLICGECENEFEVEINDRRS